MARLGGFGPTTNRCAPDRRRLQSLARACHSLMKFLAERDFQRVAIRVPDQSPIAYRRPGVFRLSSQAPFVARESAEPIDVLARLHADAEMRHG